MKFRLQLRNFGSQPGNAEVKTFGKKRAAAYGSGGGLGAPRRTAFDPYRTLILFGTNRSCSPTAVVRGSARDRLRWVEGDIPESRRSNDSVGGNQVPADSAGSPIAGGAALKCISLAQSGVCSRPLKPICCRRHLRVPTNRRRSGRHVFARQPADHRL
jgi:hypothetical protein